MTSSPPKTPSVPTSTPPPPQPASLQDKDAFPTGPAQAEKGGMDLQTVIYVAVPSFFSVLLLAIVVGYIIKKRRNKVAKGP